MRRAVLQSIYGVKDKAALIHLHPLLKEPEPQTKATRTTEEHCFTMTPSLSLSEQLTQKESEISELRPCPS